MKSIRLYLIRYILFFLPETRCFGIKRWLYRFAGAQIGKNVRICSSALILGNGKISIGDNTWIGHQVCIISCSFISIGENVDIAPRVYIGTGTHVIDYDGPHSAGTGINKDIIIANGVWLGANAIILPGVTIGNKSIIAAGAVVTKSVENKCIVGGIPAIKIKDF